MIIVSLDSLAVCVMIGILLLFISLLYVVLLNRNIGLVFFVTALVLIIVPLIILSESSHYYPRMAYGYFANLNNALRFTHSLNKPLVVENFTNIQINKIPKMMIEPGKDNQLNYSFGRKHLTILSLAMPFPQDLDEHRFPKNYEPHILSKRRHQLNMAFNAHYSIDFRILNKAGKFDSLFEKGAIGAHIRFTGHYINAKVDFDKQINAYIDYIDKSNYPYVYLATHLKDVEDIFRSKYGSRLIIYEHYRNPNKNSDWTSNNLKQTEEDTNVLIDMIMLSKCKEIIGGPSNVFWAALWYNPDVKLYIPDVLKNAIAG